MGASYLVLTVLGAVLALLNIPKVRVQFFSSGVMVLLRKLKLMPKISETEMVALKAGATWLDGELFSGAPDFKKIMKERVTHS